MPSKLKQTFILAFGIAISSTLCACNNKAEVEKRAVERAKRQQEAAEFKRKIEAEREVDCRTVRQAVASLDADSSEVVLACTKFRSSECNYKVEIMFKLEKLGKNDAITQIAKIGNDCSEELSFASKYGLEAYQEHAKILESATDAAYQLGKEETEQECNSEMEPEDGGDRDYYGRGRR